MACFFYCFQHVSINTKSHIFDSPGMGVGAPRKIDRVLLFVLLIGHAQGAPCAPGFTGPNGGPCTACLNSQYKQSSGSDVCTSCPYGSGHKNTEQVLPTSCKCLPGFSGSQDGIACSPCEMNTFKGYYGSGSCIPVPLSPSRPPNPPKSEPPPSPPQPPPPPQLSE